MKTLIEKAIDRCEEQITSSEKLTAKDGTLYRNGLRQAINTLKQLQLESADVKEDKQEWEIISFSFFSSKRGLEIFKKTHQTFQTKRDSSVYFFEEELLKKDNFKIHSVRFRDEVFTVGDETNKGKIIKFELRQFDSIYTTISLTFCTIQGDFSIDVIKKLPTEKQEVKTPLFTTEDGVYVFKGDTVYYLNRTTPQAIIEWIVNSNKNLQTYLCYFSTKEAAEKYFQSLNQKVTVKEILSDIIKLIGVMPNPTRTSDISNKYVEIKSKINQLKDE